MSEFSGARLDDDSGRGVVGAEVVADARWEFDGRLIRTAVVGGRDSTVPVYLPTDYVGASDMLRRYRHEGFFCGILLGGCGWPLRVRRSKYDLKVSHFAHRPNGPVCQRYDSGGYGSADHLFVYDGLVFLARRNGGYSHRAQRQDISIRHGRCESVLVRHETSAVRVQFTDLAEDVWRIDDGELRHSFENIQWIFGQGVEGPVKALKAQDGYVLRARCEFRDGTREVLVRMETFDATTDWIPLTDCTIAAAGIVTAAPMADLHPAHLQALLDQEAADAAVMSGSGTGRLPDYTLAIALQPVLDELFEAMNRNDCHAATSIRSTNQPLLDMLSKSALDDEKEQFRRVMRWHLKHPEYRRPPSTKVKPNKTRAAQDSEDEGKANPASTPPSRPTEKPSKARRDEATGIESEADRFAAKQRNRFIKRATTFVERLEAAKFQDDVHEVRRQVASYTDLIQELRENGPSGLRGRFIRVHAWLINQPDETSQSGKLSSPSPKKPQQQQNSDDGVERLASILRAAATAQRKITVSAAMEGAGVGHDSFTRLLVAVELATPPDSPLLTAVLSGVDGKGDSVFRRVSSALGYEHIGSDFGLQLAWNTEVERVHAFYALPQRPMAASLLRRRSPKH